MVMAEFVVVEPEWGNTLRWWAQVLAEHGFEKGAMAPVTSFMEQVRYLHVTDPDRLERILKELQAKEARS
jgi:hypothetical protein